MPTAHAAGCARFFAILALAAVPGAALAAEPQKNDPGRAHILFYEARTLMQQNKFAEACPKLEESMRLDPGLGTQFNLADCNEHIGKLASAWAGFVAVATASQATNQPEREQLARNRALALEARLPASVAAATVPVSGPPPVESEAFTTTTTTASDFPAPIIEQNGAIQRTAGWIVAGVGVVGLGLGGGFGLASLGQRNDARSHCVSNQCDAEGVRLRDDAILNGSIATVASIVGGAAVAGGLVLVLTSPRSTDPQERAGAIRAVPNVAVNGGGFMVQGSFQ